MKHITDTDFKRLFQDGEEDVALFTTPYPSNRFEEQPSTSPDFDTEVYNWLKQHGSDETRQLIEMTARHFWEMAQSGGAMLHIADKSYMMGRRDERFAMMKFAVKGHVCGRVQNHINIKVEGVDELEPKGVMHILADKSKYKIGDTVKVVILKEEDEK